MYVAVFDTVQSEKFGFGMSWSEDGVTWSEGIDVELPHGCRTPLGLIDEGNGIASMLFTRRFADCNNQTALPENGADAISPASCANVYVAHFRVLWSSASGDIEFLRGADTAEDLHSSQNEWRRQLRS